MSSPSLQLDLEQALQLWLAPVFIGGRTVHAAHAAESEPDGTFMAIIAEPPDWEEMVVNAIVPVRFEFGTVVKDSDTRAAATARHRDDIGKLIDLLCEQNFSATRDALDTIQPNDIGFTGWEATKGEPDGTTDTQIVSRLSYDFIVYLKS